MLLKLKQELQVLILIKLNFDDPLLVWTNNEYKFPELARLAKKFLSVPASVAEVEKMFNISGQYSIQNVDF